MTHFTRAGLAGLRPAHPDGGGARRPLHRLDVRHGRGHRRLRPGLDHRRRRQRLRRVRRQLDVQRPPGDNQPGHPSPYTSTIAQYSYSGTLEKTYSFLGSDDGLRYNPDTNQVWVLQNQDGNSGLTILNPLSGTSTSYTYANPSTSRGYDDAQFINGTTYLSVHQPRRRPQRHHQRRHRHPDVQRQRHQHHPGCCWTRRPASADPDSLDQIPGGGLLLTGGDDGALRQGGQSRRRARRSRPSTSWTPAAASPAWTTPRSPAKARRRCWSPTPRQQHHRRRHRGLHAGRALRLGRLHPLAGPG